MITRQAPDNLKPARNTVYGVAFLDQPLRKQGEKQVNFKGVAHSLQGSQEFNDQTPLRKQAQGGPYLNKVKAQQQSNHSLLGELSAD